MISYYELLGMIKEGNIPNRIKIAFNSEPRAYIREDDIDGTFSYYHLEDKNDEDDDYNFYLAECFLESSMFDLNIEILKEEKKIPEKIEIYEDEEGHYFIDKHCKKIYITCDEINFMVEEFNQLIDYLQSKGE